LTPRETGAAGAGAGPEPTAPPPQEGGGAAVRLQAIRARIARAAGASGRDAGEIVLVGASKVQPAAHLASFRAAGLRVFGENRVQEGLAKARELPREIEWHLLGPLQGNKVRAALDLFTTFHAVDRVKIAEAIDREAAARGLRVDGFLEVNLGGEASKHGFSPADLPASVAPLARLEHLRIAGLMAIPPPGDEPRRWFRQLRELRDRLAERPEWSGFRGWLSMGMSDDFEAAIEEGATHVRIGTALFGPRR
jgi:pyridoxal phosphate enzyme (YggS family)